MSLKFLCPFQKEELNLFFWFGFLLFRHLVAKVKKTTTTTTSTTTTAAGAMAKATTTTAMATAAVAMATAIPTNSTPKGHLSSDFSQMKQTEGEMKEEGKNKLRSASTLGDAIGQLKRKKF